MNAECGTGYSGEIRRYYKCGGKKQNSGCQKQTIRKDELEKIVIATTLSSLTKENLEIIVDAVMECHRKKSKDNSVIELLSEERKKIEKAINNLLDAIQQGIVTPTTKARLEELEKKAEEIGAAISIEEYKKGKELKREEVLDYIKAALKKSPQIMLDLLVQKVVLYDDKIEIYYNYIDNKGPDSDGGTFTLHGILEYHYTLHYKKNELSLKSVQLIPTWLLLTDSN